MLKRAGYYRKNLSGDAAYYSFVPNSLPPDPAVAVDEDIISLLTDTTSNVTKLDILSAYIPDKDLFIFMYIRKEALLSSQIEGTQATIEDILDPTQEINTNRDVAEVVSYIKAAMYALERLKTLPLCNRLIREVHNVLMQNARGSDKNPGEFRRSQNWIGGQGSTISTAKYIPPCPDDMTEAISDLEKFIHEDDYMNPLIKAALIHYQFETIHPFLDGNGRIGRLLVTLFLVDKNVITSPIFYISYFLKLNRIEYYDRMTEVRDKGNYEQWVKFFLTAINESAKDAIRTIEELSALNAINEGIISKMRKAKFNTLRLFDYLKKNPIIDIRKTADALGLSYNTASAAVKRLTDAGVLAQSENKGRRKIFIYEGYLKILRRGT